MFQRLRAMLLIPCLLLTTSCTLSGSWQAVGVFPKEAEPAFERITFAKDRYTATEPAHAQARTVTGTYEWNRSRLDVMPDDGAKRTFSGRLRPDGMLILVEQVGPTKVETTLEQVRPD